MSYRASVKDIEYMLNEVVKLSDVAALPGFEEATPDMVSAILDESMKFTSEVLAPLNRLGDEQGCQWSDDGVSTPDGWKEAYQQFCENGWNALSFSEEFGGQGLPMCVSAAVQEMWHASNMAFGLCPLLTQGAVDAIENHASDELKAAYLPKMVEGVWSGTMNLTEPQAGSDLAAIRTTAEPDGDSYRIKGQKIYITYGEHDLTDNIVHLVLARLPDAPPGVKGISLFIVPKFLVNDDGSLGERNDLKCISIEHKLGIHASPTCVMSYGDNDGAIGYLVGQEHHGLVYMFTMMNQARHAVGVEGYSIAEGAYQKALEYAKERKQGKTWLGKSEDDHAIVNHPDVRRILMNMKSGVEAMRGLGLECAAAFDRARNHPDESVREFNLRRGELLTPLVKGWSTEFGVELCSEGVQVHGGMGFIEETGAAQYLRDARITPIYEGTTAIQANDLIGRKLARDKGQGMTELMTEMRATLNELEQSNQSDLQAIAAVFSEALDAGEEATQWMLSQKEPAKPAAASVEYLMLNGRLAGGWMMARLALAANRQLSSEESDKSYLEARIGLAKFYAQHVLPAVGSSRSIIIDGTDSTIALDVSQL